MGYTRFRCCFAKFLYISECFYIFILILKSLNFLLFSYNTLSGLLFMWKENLERRNDKKMLKRREECNTNLTNVCRHRWSSMSLMKRWNIRSFQPTLWLSSPVDIATADESQSVSWKLLIFLLFTGLFLLQQYLQTWIR